MKNMFNKILLLITFCVLANLGNAQSSVWNFSWDIGFPTGETADFIERTSFRGFSVQGRSFIKSNISVGGSFGWQVFNEKIEETIEFSFQPDDVDRPITGALSGVQFRNINAIPIMVNAYYYLGDALPTATRPYAGASLGVVPIKKRTEIGVLSIDDLNWHFGIAPEVGVLYPVNESLGITAALKYNIALKANDSINYSYFGISIGLASIY